MVLQRRDFLKRGVGLVAASMVVPAFLAETARLLQSRPTVATAQVDTQPAADASRKVLVVVLLAGGTASTR